MTEFFDRAAFERLRQERDVTWGRPLRLFERTSSTNDRALEELEAGMKTGGVFVAFEQTAGRGRQGAAWESPPGENLTFTVALRLPVPPERVQHFPLLVGLALHDAVKPRLPSPAGLGVKWPNDLYFGSKKVAGILVESRASRERDDRQGRTDSTSAAPRSRDPELLVAVGIGLNVETLDFGEQRARRTSLRQICVEGASASTPDDGQRRTPADLGKESLVADILGALEARTRTWVRAGFAGCLEALRAVDALRGQRLRVADGLGQGAGLDHDGALLVELDDGAGRTRRLLRVQSGSVEFPPRA